MEEPHYLQDQPDPIRDSALERSLPHSAEAERAILGAALLNEMCLLQAMELMEPEDFYIPSHRRIYVAMIALFERGADINPILIANELKKENMLESVGGISFITNLTYGLPHTTNISHYAEVVTGKAKLRQLVKSANKITQEAIEEEDEPEIILSHAETLIYELTETRYKTQLQAIDFTLPNVIDDAYSNIGAGMSVTGLATGLTDLDKVTTGLQKSDLILLAARPSVGKTAEAVSIIANVAIDFEKLVAFFSLEMGRYAIQVRLLCNVAKVDFQRFRQGFMNHQEWDAITAAQNKLTCNRIFVDDKPGITMLEARAKLHRLAKTFGMPDLIVFDYLQLMTGLREHRKESRQQEVSGIAESLKSLAKEFDRPVLALSQLNRGPEQRADKRPQLSDLRESGALEQHADVVIFIHDPKADNPAILEQIVAKNRNGPTGEFGIYFNGPAMRFDNLA